MKYRYISINKTFGFNQRLGKLFFLMVMCFHSRLGKKIYNKNV